VSKTAQVCTPLDFNPYYIPQSQVLMHIARWVDCLFQYGIYGRMSNKCCNGPSILRRLVFFVVVVFLSRRGLIFFAEDRKRTGDPELL
jgi:hypothetical protein